jgi:molybdate transport system substrate-binding protein
MKIILRKKIAILFSLAMFFAQNSFAAQSRNLTIFAEPNLALPLTKITRQYSRVANVIVSLNFTSAYNLVNSIDSGEPVDLFISAQSDWIEMLHQKGVVDIYNLGYIAQDNIVLVAQKDNKNIPSEFAEKNMLAGEIIEVLNKHKVSIIIDEPNNSSGFFARKFLEEFQTENIRVFSRISEDKTPLLSTINNDKENYSVLLKSQINSKKNDFRILAQLDKKIFYQALVIAGDNMEVAREFLKFLKSDQSKSYLRSYGFTVN